MDEHKDSEELIQRISELEAEAEKQAQVVSDLQKEISHLLSEQKTLISEQKVLKENEFLYRGIYNNMTSGSAVYKVINDGSSGADYIVQRFNNSGLRIVNRSLEEVQGKTLKDLRPHIDDSTFINTMQQVWKSGVPAMASIVEKADDIFLHFLENYIFRVDTGEVVTIYNDLTEQKNADIRLKKSQERYKKAQAMGKLGHWEYDPVKNVFWGSYQARKIYGLDPEKKWFPADFMDLCTPQADVTRRALLNLINHNTPYDQEYDFYPLDGSPMKIVHSTGERICCEDGNTVKVVGVIQDVTEQRLAEKSRMKLERELRQAQKQHSIGLLASGIAHDFNNILASIIGFTSLALNHAKNDPKMENYLQEIYQGSIRAKELVKQILAFSRQAEVELFPISIGDIVSDGMNLIRSIIPSNIEIREKIFSKTKVLAESTQIHQVLMNLCTNAAQAMGPDGGTISISVSDVHLPTDSEDEFQLTLPEGDYVRLKVSDTGSGIPEDAIDSIFNPYFTTKTPEKGTGMGLAIVHSIIKGCNGEISVKTETEIGTVFSVFIPSTNEAEPPKAYKKDDFPGGTETILLVDDEMGIITSTGGILKALGYTVVGCNDSRDALKLIEEDISRFDILMTDMTMPHLTGDKLAEAAMKLKKNFPVIICTGYSERMTSEIAAEMGIKAFLLKPIDINDLTATLRNALEGAS